MFIFNITANSRLQKSGGNSHKRGEGSFRRLVGK